MSEVTFLKNTICCYWFIVFREETYLLFVYGQLRLFNKMILAQEKTKVSSSSLLSKLYKYYKELQECWRHVWIV
jgi:hypothetical protein